MASPKSGTTRKEPLSSSWVLMCLAMVFLTSLSSAVSSGGGGSGGNSGNDAGNNASANTGSGGGGGAHTNGGPSSAGGNGGSGIVILKYLSASGTITIGGSLTSSSADDGDYKVVSFTAGSDNVSWA